MNTKDMKTAKTKAEVWRTAASIVQVCLAIATLVILIVVHFL